MPTAPQRPQQRKDAIFQAIYEDNRALAVGGTVRRPSYVRRRRWTFALTALLVVLASAGAWGGASYLATSAASPMAPEVEDGPAGAFVFAEPLGPMPRPANAADAELARLLDLQVRTIVIDPGHGGRDPGAVGRSRLEEKDVALDVARRLGARLARRSELAVRLTRDADRLVSLKERVAFANEAGADLFVSIHVNALPDTALAPVETYFFGVDAEGPSRALAHAENGGSTFSVAEFNAALRRAGTAVKLQESRALALAVQRALLRERAVSPAPAADWGAKAAPFNVLLHTEAPAILTEITALSNPAEEARLRTPAYREAIAAALERGILTYLRLEPPLTNGRQEER